MSHYLREFINEYFSNKITDKQSVSLLFSGGTDSLTCLFSLLDLGIKPKLYSFHLENIIHDDIVISKQVSDYYQLQHEIIEIKRDIRQLKNDVQYLIPAFNITRKTNVQCTYPFLHVLPHIEEQYVVTGLCADDLYGSAKSVTIKAAKDKTVFDEIRNKTFDNLYSSAYKPIKELVENVYNKTLIAPYREPKIIDFFMQFSWSELNKPKQKQLSLTAYEDFFSRQNIYRRNNNLQVGSKIREWHSELVLTDINKYNRRRVDEIYKDLGKELIK
jgi:asparagine synthetase B (glutamine-hydrolysing)